MADELHDEAQAKAKAKSKTRNTGKQAIARPWVYRLLNPHSWTLRWRFVYLSGALLLVGNLCLILFFVLAMNRDMNLSVQDQLKSLRSRVESRLERERSYLLAQVRALATLPGLRTALYSQDRESIRTLLLPYADNLRTVTGATSLGLHCLSDDLESFAYTASVHDWRADTSHDSLLARMREDSGPLVEVGLSPEGFVLRAAAPVRSAKGRVGVVMASLALRDVFRGMELASRMGLSVLRDNSLDAPASKSTGVDDAEPGIPAIAMQPEEQWGHVRPAALQRALAEGMPKEHALNSVFAFLPLKNLDGKVLGGLLFSCDTQEYNRDKWQNVILLAALFWSGSALLLVLLFYNVGRVEKFLERLKKIILSSHSSDFAQRFESDHVHCLEVLHCHNEECPVYKNPSLVCYLETGSEAISPVWRDTCVYLNKYDSCLRCPVYAMRRGDELMEMRNVINTMMRLWSDFLGRVGHLLSYVLRSSEMSGRRMALDEVSQRLEQMAKLTFFGHDLQGVLDREEVYTQLGWVFEEGFGIDTMLLYEIDTDGEHAHLVMDTTGEDPLCKQVVCMNPEACRAKRVAEDVVSFYNPNLCPHFACDTDTMVRCCLPLVMSGQVGAVCSFIVRKRDWERIREQLPILRKYLDESAPVLSSLRLLEISQEQALRDPLTRCHNRRFLDEFITKYEPLSERDKRRTGFLMVDVDYFKQVNDEHGHEAGDAVLQQLVGVLQAGIRRSDLLIRYGGEEFLVLLQDVQAGTPEQVAEKLRNDVETHAFALPDGSRLQKTVSVGVAEYPEDAGTLYKSIKFADVALYEAKNSGRNRVVRFQPEMWTEEQY